MRTDRMRKRVNPPVDDFTLEDYRRIMDPVMDRVAALVAAPNPYREALERLAADPAGYRARQARGEELPHMDVAP